MKQSARHAAQQQIQGGATLAAEKAADKSAQESKSKALETALAQIENSLARAR